MHPDSPEILPAHTSPGSSNLLFQNLIYQAGFNPNVLPLGSSSCDVDPTAPCHVFWNGGTKAYTSVILIGNGLSFLSQSLVFLTIGSLADYGNWNPWVVRVISVICWAFEFGFLGLRTASKWRAAMALYILSSMWFLSFAQLTRVNSNHCRHNLVGVVRILQCGVPKARQRPPRST